MPALRQATLACLGKSATACVSTPAAWRLPTSTRCAARSATRSIDLYAVSYGTRVAELYMRRYPGAVHAVILDGVTYPEQAIGPDTPLDGERALDLILARCRARPDCAAAYPAACGRSSSTAAAIRAAKGDPRRR